MPTYQAPAQDYQFILNELLRVQDRHDLPGFDALTPEFCRQVLDGAARFHEEVFFPLAATGDAQGARLEDGQVRTPDGYRQAWATYRESGWLSLSLPEAIGGAGLPAIIAAAVGEMRITSAQSLHMYFGFCISVARMLHEVGEPWMKELVAPKLAAGEWTATMCMTEAHCGSDVRQIRTQAVERPDGTWSVTGTKIFISGGDHDLAENIMHIVLARVPREADARSSSLSDLHVFLVPKLGIEPASGSCGADNHVFVDSIEHKMGIEGNATCVMRFEGARGWRIPAPPQLAQGTGSNMAPMFMLMNYARAGTALSGVGYAELAAQNATAYARDRLVGRAADGARRPDLAGDPLIVHPDIRRLLLGARAFAEGGRATAMRALLWQQEAESLADKARRSVARDLMELMTPVMKAYFTDRAFSVVNDCLQVLGGHGYIREYGLEQMVRNVRVAQLYEGANGIQAIDLVQRKLPARDWQPARSLVAELRAFARTAAGTTGLSTSGAALHAAADDLEAVFGVLKQRSATAGPGANLPVAYDVLEMCGIALVGWSWAAILTVLDARSALPDSLRRRKTACAHHWMEYEMPKIAMLRGRVGAGLRAVMELDEADL
ncbi:MAG: acyl-CoA dehydrogenase family protein [Pseudomonadota bacterium]